MTNQDFKGSETREIERLKFLPDPASSKDRYNSWQSCGDEDCWL